MANGAENRYFLDGIDMYTAYGFVVTGGSDDLLQIPAIKLPLSFNWPDQSGTDWDLESERTIEDRPVKLSGYLVAVSEADFWTKYEAFKMALLSIGTKTLKCAEFADHKTVNVFYKDCSKVTRRTRVKNTQLIGMEMDIEFITTGASYTLPPVVTVTGDPVFSNSVLFTI